MSDSYATRYWLPDGAELEFDRSGFMPDPSNKWSAAWVPNVRSYAEIDERACLVLIGEPGLGKTTALQRAAAQVRKDPGTGEDEVLFVDLSASAEESVLRSRIFEAPEWKRWLTGNHRLHLFLDTLDFALLRIETIGELLEDGLSHAPVERLALRLTCRTADRYRELETWLQRHFGPDQFGRYALLPFTRADVRDAASARGLDPDAFLRSVIDKQLQPLAMIPGTLNMLLDIACEYGELPDSRAEVYQQASELLCREPAERRSRSRAGPPALTASKRFAVAERIAGLMLLAAQAAIATSEQACAPGIAKQAVFVGGEETDRLIGAPTHFAVDQQAVRDTLGTGLFAGTRDGLLNFRHKTYGEFLCARWLADGALSDEQIDDLLFSDHGGRMRVIPQLREVASWLTALSSDFAARLLRREPAVLVRADPASVPGNDRAAIVTALLSSIASYELQRFDIPVRNALPHLAHPGLAEQLRAVLNDEARDTASRETAADAAGACKVTELEAELVALALDAAAPVGLRDACVHALGEFASEDARRELVQLAIMPPPEDFDDELRGAALAATWPSVLSLGELLGSLTPPKRANLYGSYKHFLRNLLVQGLVDDELATALLWSATLPVEHAPRDGLSDLREQLLIRAAGRLEDDDILAAVAEVGGKLLANHSEIFTQLTLEEHPGLLSQEQDRHRVLAAIVSRGMLSGEQSLDAAELVMSGPSLAPGEDAEWVAVQLVDRVGTPEEPAWAAVLEAMLLNGAEEEVIFRARELSPILAALTRHRYDAVPIDSPEADAMREHHRRFEEMQLRHEEARAPRFDVGPKVAEAQAMWDAGDVDGFWVALAWMEQVQRLGGFLISDPRKLAGWDLVDEETHAWLEAAAPIYLRKAQVDPAGWFLARRVYEPAWAGYRALRLIATTEEELSFIECEVIARWAPVIVGWPAGETGDDHFDRWAIARLVSCAPAQAAAWLKEALRRERSEGHAFAVRRFTGLLVPDVERVVLARARDSRHAASQRDELIGFLMEGGAESGWALARRLVVPSAVKAGGERRELAVSLAVRLVTGTPDGEWGRIWPLIGADEQFGRDLVTRLSREIEPFVARRLTESQLAELFNWLEARYPRVENPIQEGAHFVDARERVVIFKDQLLRELVARGTDAALQEFDELVATHPDLRWLRRLREQTREAASLTAWISPTPGEVLAMAQEHARRWIVSDQGLRRVVMAALATAATRLKGRHPQVALLWTDDPPEPRGEQRLSDWIAEFLENELQRRGIVIGRETQVHPSVTGKGRGKSIDLRIDAVAGAHTQGPAIVTVMMEVKGSWNRDVLRAMESQLVDRYLTGSITQGIYLTGYYAADAWNESDTKRKAARRHTLDGLSKALAEQAAEVSERRLVGVSSFVLDCSLGSSG